MQLVIDLHDFFVPDLLEHINTLSKHRVKTEVRNQDSSLNQKHQDQTVSKGKQCKYFKKITFMVL